MITSPSNPRIKAAASLRKRRIRDAEQRFLVEGVRPVARALDAGWSLLAMFIDPELPAAAALSGEAIAAGIDVTEVTGSAMSKLTYRTEPEGVVAVAAHRSFPLAGLPVDGGGLYLITEAIEKPGNIGAMLRTAEAVGVAGVVAADAATDLTNPNVVRASQGSLFAVPVAAASATDAKAWLSANQITPVAASPDSDRPLWDADLTGGVAVVVGSEHEGLSTTWADVASVRIPMHGAGDSLNAATSAAVVLFESLRQRSQ